MRRPEELDAFRSLHRQRLHGAEVVGRQQQQRAPGDVLVHARARVCISRADEGDVRNPRPLDVVEIARLAAEDALVLAPPDGTADEHYQTSAPRPRSVPRLNSS